MFFRLLQHSFVLTLLSTFLPVSAPAASLPLCQGDHVITCEFWPNTSQRVTHLTLYADKKRLPGHFQSFSQAASPSASAVLLHIPGLDDRATRMVARALHVFGGALPTNQGVGLFESAEDLRVIAPISTNVNHFSWKARSLMPNENTGNISAHLQQLIQALGALKEKRRVLFWVTINAHLSPKDNDTLNQLLSAHGVRLVTVRLHLPGYTDHPNQAPDGAQRMAVNSPVESKPLIDTFLTMALLPHNGGILTVKREAAIQAGICGSPRFVLRAAKPIPALPVAIHGEIPPCPAVVSTRMAASIAPITSIAPVHPMQEPPASTAAVGTIAALAEIQTHPLDLPPDNETTDASPVPTGEAPEEALIVADTAAETPTTAVPLAAPLAAEILPVVTPPVYSITVAQQSTPPAATHPLPETAVSIDTAPLPSIPTALHSATVPWYNSRLFQFCLFVITGFAGVLVFLLFFRPASRKSINAAVVPGIEKTVVMALTHDQETELATRISFGYLVHHDAQSPQPFVLNKPTVTVGRAVDNDIIVSQKTVSAHHLEINCGRNTGVSITDLGSTNGTSVNGKPVKQTCLKAGDVLELGEFKFVFERNLSALGRPRSQAS